MFSGISFFLAISFYGYYNYKNHTAELTERVLRENHWTRCYISALHCLFLGRLFVLRIVPLLVKGIFYDWEEKVETCQLCFFLKS